MSDRPSSEWKKWTSLLFEGSDGAGRAVGDAWADWFRELRADKTSGHVAEEWLRTAQTTGYRLTQLIKHAQAWLEDHDGQETRENLDELKYRIERLERLLPSHLNGEINGPPPTNRHTASQSSEPTT